MAFLARLVIAQRGFMAAPVMSRATSLGQYSAPLSLETRWHLHRMFSSEPPKGEADGGGASAGAGAEPEAAPTPVEVLEAQLATQTDVLKSQKDQLLRALADAENARNIAKRDVESARQFAVTKFAKSMLEVADNLNLAMTSIPAEEVEKAENGSLKTLMEGVSMTENLLMKAFREHGLQKYGAVGDAFDPNFHDALFEMPVPDAEPNTVAQVLKEGYTLRGRVIRPATVGTVKNA